MKIHLFVGGFKRGTAANLRSRATPFGQGGRSTGKKAECPLYSPARITGAAGSDPVATEALDMFAAMLGTAAPNLALSLGARGGVYIGGGIAPRLGKAFPDARFRAPVQGSSRYGESSASDRTGRGELRRSNELE